MAPYPLDLILLADTFAICRLPADASLPNWALAPSEFVTISRTSDELSIAAAERLVPPDLTCERDFRALKVAGPLAFGQIGIIAALASALAARSVSIFVVSTFDTDYVLVKAALVGVAIETLRQDGHQVTHPFGLHTSRGHETG